MEENKENIEEVLEETEDAAADAEVESEDDAPVKHKDKKKLKKAEAEIASLTQKLTEEQDKYMRLYAEYDNFRRRSVKEREGVYSEVYCDAVLQILP
ncbi:MAG: nucleotide exchange factor GrpE, partial [Clostridia bacterium]|nr:nucleotide exchange factor GrpE [Clostridia bacterium]